MTRQEWEKSAERGTSGDMVWDILQDWAKQEKVLILQSRREVVEFANKFLEIADHGDYSSGIEAFGIDEGRVQAYKLLTEWRDRWLSQLKSWGIE